MKEIHLIVTGILKDKNLKTLENNYIKQIKNPHLIIHELKSQSENVELEGEQIIKKINNIKKTRNISITLLTEKGKNFDSCNFSKWLYKKMEDNLLNIMVIGGAFGFSKKVRSISNFELSLSNLTFPHKIARIILIEQIYRAQTIYLKHPYHK